MGDFNSYHTFSISSAQSIQDVGIKYRAMGRNLPPEGAGEEIGSGDTKIRNVNKIPKQKGRFWPFLNLARIKD